MSATVLGGRYELGTRIGRGGMAEVRVARDLRLRRTVAVKILRDDLPDEMADPTLEARFRREAQIVAALDHPSIVSVLDTGEQARPDGTRLSYIVMEHVAGRTLRQLLDDSLPSPDEALGIVDWVGAALEIAHRAGVVHRDIKPSNVMITPAGTVKVMDFGIARALDSTTTLTKTAAVLGTAQYVSPEQIRGEKADARADLYSLGCLMFELLTGRPPFVSGSVVSLLYQHLNDTPPAPSTLNPAVPAALDRIVARALVKDRDLRYQTATELRVDLRTWQDAALPTSLSLALAAPARPALARPSRRLVVTALVVGLLVVGLSTAGVWRLTQDSTRTGTPSPSPPGATSTSTSTSTPTVCWDGSSTGQCPPLEGLDAALTVFPPQPAYDDCRNTTANDYASTFGVLETHVCDWENLTSGATYLRSATPDQVQAYYQAIWTNPYEPGWYQQEWYAGSDRLGTLFVSSTSIVRCYEKIPFCVSMFAVDPAVLAEADRRIGSLTPAEVAALAAAP
ncbi:MAG: protein kinase [Micrococcales bacterium]|nr:protein kinase [Micrococcales bacterium]